MNSHKNNLPEIDLNNEIEGNNAERIDEQEEIEAILNLDFERAFVVSQRNMQIQTAKLYEESENEHAYYQNQSEMLTQQIFEEYNTELTDIRQTYLDNAEYYKTVWQDYCKKLVQKQRDEAALLETKWREARNHIIRNTKETMNTKLATARLLAMCKLFDDAIEVREEAQTIGDKKKSPEIRKIDREFAKQYKNMTSRHYAEFQYLYQHLRSLMSTLRTKADTMRKTAEANLEVEKARNNAIIIKTVAEDNVSRTAKERIFQDFSPRTRNKQTIKKSPRHFNSSFKKPQ